MAHDLRAQITELTQIIEEAHSAGLPSGIVYHHRQARNVLRTQLRKLLWNSK